MWVNTWRGDLTKKGQLAAAASTASVKGDEYHQRWLAERIACLAGMMTVSSLLSIPTTRHDTSTHHARPHQPGVPSSHVRVLSSPNSRPVIGCNKTLRKGRLRTQTFEDLGVEREVDIRKRVMATSTRSESKEIRNLQPRLHLSKSGAEVARSIVFSGTAVIRAGTAQLRRRAAREEYERENNQLLTDHDSFLSRLAAGAADDAANIARESQKILLKKFSARRSEEDRLRQKQAALRDEGKKSSALRQKALSLVVPWTQTWNQFSSRA